MNLLLFFSFLQWFKPLAIEEQILASAWTDGIVLYEVEKQKDGSLFFRGANIAENGIVFSLQASTAQKGLYLVKDGATDFVSGATSVEFKNFNGKNYLISSGSGNSICKSMKAVDKGRSIWSIYFSLKEQHLLAGTYLNKQDKSVVVIDYKTQSIEGLSLGSKYVFKEDYSSIEYGINIGGKDYKIGEAGECMGIFQEDAGYDDDPLVVLEKIKYPFETKVAGRFPFTSTELLVDGVLIWYSLKELKIMRNEIFARHGLIFKTPEMKNHFESKPWYKGSSNDVNGLLSELEKANVALIAKMEKQMSVQD